MNQRKRRRLVGRLVAGAAILLTVGFVAMGFLPKPVSVNLGKVEQRSIDVTVSESGKTRVRSRYVISAPVIGNLSRVQLEEGDEVHAGEVVAEITPVASGLLDERSRAEATARVSVAQANLARSEATIKRAEASKSFAKDQAQRIQKLYESRGTSKESLDRALYELRAAEEEHAAAVLGQKVIQNELSMARAALVSSDPKQRGPVTVKLTAPIDGTVLRIFQESETVVQPGAQLVEIGDPHGLEVVVDVLTTDAVRIQRGTSASIERWGGEGALRAAVRRKEPSAFTTRSALGVEEQRVAVILDFVEPKERYGQLGDGFRVEAEIRLQHLPDVLAVPASAVFRDGKRWVVFSVRDGEAREVEIDSGARTPDWVEVRRGLSAGDSVILYPSDQIRDGVAVVGT